MTDAPELLPPEGAEESRYHWVRRDEGYWLADLMPAREWRLRGTIYTPADAAWLGYTYHAPARPDDATERARLEREVARLREAVRSAYNEGFSEGMREHSTSRGGRPWVDSTACKKLEALRHD